MPLRVFEDGAVVCRAGDPAEAVFRVREGALRIEPAGAGPGIHRVLVAGDVFGADTLLSGSIYGATARAAGRTVVELVGRPAVLAALEARPEVVRPLIAAAFEHTPPEPPECDRPAFDGIGRALRLIPAEPATAAQIGADGVLVATFPFVVGRRESRGETNGARGVDLILRDQAPYSLSRRHFAIEREGGQYRVRDCGSYHGTIVNGTRIGAGASSLTAPLRAGDNEIVAGKAHSTIRFSFFVG